MLISLLGGMLGVMLNSTLVARKHARRKGMLCGCLLRELSRCQENEASSGVSASVPRHPGGREV